MIAFNVPGSNHAEPDWTPAGPVMFNGIDATIQSDPGDEDDGARQIARAVWNIRERVAAALSSKLGADIRPGKPGVYIVQASQVSITMKLQPSNPAWCCRDPHDPGDEDRGVLVRFLHPLGFHEVA